MHWDLMLDVGAVLRTWAIDAPIVAGCPAGGRMVVDHRRIYLTTKGRSAAIAAGSAGRRLRALRALGSGRRSASAWSCSVLSSWATSSCTDGRRARVRPGPGSTQPGRSAWGRWTEGPCGRVSRGVDRSPPWSDRNGPRDGSAHAESAAARASRHRADLSGVYRRVTTGYPSSPCRHWTSRPCSCA